MCPNLDTTDFSSNKQLRLVEMFDLDDDNHNYTQISGPSLEPKTILHNDESVPVPILLNHEVPNTTFVICDDDEQSDGSPPPSPAFTDNSNE